MRSHTKTTERGALLRLMLVLWLLAEQCSALHAVETYYVDNVNGSDSNPGTEALPWKTPAKVQASITANRTNLVYLRGGIHTNRWDDAALGAFPGGSSWANATLFASYPGETAEIKGQFPNGEYPIHHRFTSWLIWSNIVVNCTNGYSGVVITDDAHHIRFVKMVVKDVPRSHCFLISPGSGSLNKFVEIIDCDLLNFGYNKQVGDNDLHGAYISTSSNLVEYCDINASTANGSWGIHHFTGGANPLGCIFRYNRISGIQSGGGITIAGGDDALVYGNKIWGISTGRAIGLDQGSARAKVLNNTVHDCNAGLFVGNSGVTIGSEIENNIFVLIDSSEGAIGIGTGASNTIVKNNLAYSNVVDYVNNGANTTSSGNLFGPSYNAQFVSPGASPPDLHIGATNSSARNAGLAQTEFSVDHDGDSIPQGSGTDIGYDEFVEGGGGLPTVTVAANDASATEGGDTGQFIFSRDNTNGTLNIVYTISGSAVNGTDYNTISSPATITAGNSTVTVTITPIQDALIEGTETVTVTISTDAAYERGTPFAATVEIGDDDNLKLTRVRGVPAAGGR